MVPNYISGVELGYFNILQRPCMCFSSYAAGHPRTYPMAFARRVVDLFEDLKKAKKGQPALPNAVPPAVKTFAEMEWGSPSDVGFADLPSVYKYLRFGKDLLIPPEWAGMFPKRIN